MLAQNYYFTRNPQDFALTTYAAYNEKALYLAFESTRRLRYMISIDGSGGDGRFESPVRHPAGDTDTHNLDNKANHFGDSWGDGNHLYAYHGGDTLQVWDGEMVPGAQVASQESDGYYRTELLIPRALPAGAAYTWYPSNAPVVDGLTLDPGHVIGLNVTFSNYEDSDGSEFSGTWTGLFETHSFVDFRLQSDPIPTLSEWSLGIMAFLFILAAMFVNGQREANQREWRAIPGKGARTLLMGVALERQPVLSSKHGPAAPTQPTSPA